MPIPRENKNATEVYRDTCSFLNILRVWLSGTFNNTEYVEKVRDHIDFCIRYMEEELSPEEDAPIFTAHDAVGNDIPIPPAVELLFTIDDMLTRFPDGKYVNWASVKKDITKTLAKEGWK